MIRFHLLLIVLISSVVVPAAAEDRLNLLFLGDNGHHQPARRASELLPVLAERGIDVQYTADVAAALTPQRLHQMDGLIVYANIDRIEESQAKALLDYVNQGGGFIPLHCASFCFRNNDDVVALIGAQFQRHGKGVFRVEASPAAADHPIMQGYRSFESWDETYVHTKHNEQHRTVLEYRREGGELEPWTWVRTHGEGRVFYTAWGHDHRTFHNPGFHNLVERGIRWACGADPTVAADFAGSEAESDPLTNVKMTPRRTDVKAFEYLDVGPKIPNYVQGPKWGAQEKPKNMMQKPLDPIESMKHYRTPEGFSLELFASEPDLGGKPICMSWDEQGRLWVAESFDYPNELQPPGQGRDRIRICADTDGDGKADQFTVFADKLSIPTSIARSHGGIIVHQAPDTLFLKDTTGDGVADLRKVLFTGWKTHDTHAGPSNLSYGPDNWFYGIVGYSGFEGEIAGQPQSFRTGFYRFRVEPRDQAVVVTDFEFLRNTNNNSWGIGFSEEGLLFGSTANRNPSEFMPVANRYYERVLGWTSSMLTGIADTHLFRPDTEKVRQVDHHGGYTAAAGHALYTARRYPKEYWNRTAFVTGPTGHLVGTFVLTRSGSEFQSTNPANLLASDDEWAAPIMAEVGPDGNVWVIDWYNYIVQHNPTPIGFEKGPGNAYLTDLRDKTHGRIYRVVYGKDPDHVIKSLEEATSAQLLAALAADNLFWRRHAQRLLVERGDQSVVSDLIRLVNDSRVDEIGMNVAAIHALRTLSGLGATELPDVRKAVAGAMSHPSPGVVRTAVEVVPRDELGRTNLLASGVIESSDAQVCLSALLALSDMPPSEQAARAVLECLSRPKYSQDRWIRDAAVSAAVTCSQDFLKLACQEETFSDPPLAGSSKSLLMVVAEHLARSRNTAAIEALAGPLVDAVPTVQNGIVQGLATGWPKDAEAKLSAEADQSLLRLFDRLPPSSKGQLIRLAKRWGSQKLASNADQIARSLLDIAESEAASGRARVEAAQELIGLLPEDLATVEKLLATISARTPQTIALGIVDAIQGSRAEVGGIMLREMDRFTPRVRSDAIRVLLARPETSHHLLDGIADRTIRRDELTLDQQQALLMHPNRALRGKARRVLSGSGGLPSPDREQVLASLMKTTQQTGNVERGKAIFKKNCANCHVHRGEGSRIGPDLTGMAVHPKAELLTHIIDPSRSVEGNFRNYSVLTLDGIVITGMLASETQTAVEVFDAQGKKHVVLREDIDRLVASKKSVMPEGFEKQIDENGFKDLLEFLTSKGKYLPLPIGQVASAISTKGMFHQGDDGADRLIFQDWSPKVVGGVPFQLIDPQGKRIRNIILLNGPRGTMPPKMPKSVRVPCRTATAAIHLLSGVSGWGFPAHQPKSNSMTVRLHLEDGGREDHRLINGVHFADYIRRVDVPGSKFAMMARGQQLRHVVVKPSTNQTISEIELIKGDDPTAPIIVALTVETASP